MANKLLDISKKHLDNILLERKDDCLNKILSTFIAVYTYDSVSFEGKNRMPFEDVKKLLKNEGILRHSEREKKEVLNHQKAFDLVVSWSKEKKELDEDMVKDLHAVLLDGIMPGGIYRNVNIQIPQASHQPPNHIKVYDRMKKMFAYLDEFVGTPVEKGVYVHGTIAKIHPFLDGNGRVARLILNYYLLKADYLPVSVSLTNRKEYFETLEVFKHEKDMRPLLELIEGELLEHYDKVLLNFDK